MVGLPVSVEGTLGGGHVHVCACRFRNERTSTHWKHERAPKQDSPIHRKAKRQWMAMHGNLLDGAVKALVDECRIIPRIPMNEHTDGHVHLEQGTHYLMSM
jgi:hypothetical protein